MPLCMVKSIPDPTKYLLIDMYSNLGNRYFGNCSATDSRDKLFINQSNSRDLPIFAIFGLVKNSPLLWTPKFGGCSGITPAKYGAENKSMNRPWGRIGSKRKYVIEIKIKSHEITYSYNQRQLMKCIVFASPFQWIMICIQYKKKNIVHIF